METNANWNSFFNFSLSADDDGNLEEKFPEYLKLEIQNAIQQLRSIKTIQSTQDILKIKEILQYLWSKDGLPGFTTAQRLCNLDRDKVPWQLIAIQEYADLLQSVAQLLKPEWPGHEMDSKEKFIFNIYKLDYNFDFIMESWNCLVNKISTCPASVMTIFEFLLEDENFLSITFLQICKEKAQLLQEFKATLNVLPEPKMEQFNIKVKEFIQMLSSLPNRLANALQGKVKDFFLASHYSKNIMQHLLKSLWFLLHCNDEKQEFFDMQFLADILSRLVVDFCNNMENETELLKFLEILQEFCYGSSKAKNHIQHILLLINDNTAIYRLTICMLKGSLNIVQLLGNCIKINEEWQFCFMHKLALQRIPNQDLALTTLVRYICQVDNTLLRQLFENLLNVWSKRICLQKLSLNEHLNLSKLLIITAKFYYALDKNKQQEDQDLKRLLHEGLRHHLECSDTLQRHIGMKTVELIFNFMEGPNTPEEDKLKFDYSSIMQTSKGVIVKEIDDLNENINIKEIKENYDPKHLEILLEKFMQSNGNNEHKSLIKTDSNTGTTFTCNIEIEEITPPPSKSPKMELDSDDDDDLQPYDMSNDTSQIMDKSPKFLLDLLSTLSTKCENYEHFEAALNVAEELIRSQLPKSDSRLAVDLMQLFLNLDMQFYYENFEETKFKCCVAICSAHPAECAEYICRQFHTDNTCYNANLRIVMLQILAGTVKELTGSVEQQNSKEIKEITTSSLTHLRKFKFENEQQQRLALAQHTIRQRLREKTKRYFSKTKTPQTTKSNRFHPVVGTFFFALVRGERTKQMLYVKYDRIAHDIDTMLLVNFLHTLSIIVMGAQNCPLLPTMAREIFDLCSFVRFSPETRVRLSCLELLGITLVTTPEYILIEQFNDRLLELRYWLEDFVKSPLVGGETSEECRELASQILNTCYKIMNPGDMED